MTRIAYVSMDFGVPVFGRKGCSIHAQEVLRALIHSGSEIDLFTTNPGGEPLSDLRAVRTHSLPRPPKGEPAGREQAALANNLILREALEDAGPFDFIYERYSLWSYAGMEFARDIGRTGLLEINAPLIEEQAEYRVLVDRSAAESTADRVFRAASALLPVSEEVAEYLRRFPGAANKTHILPNGVRPERFPVGRVPALPAPPGVWTVGFVGTLKAWHGLTTLVEAFGALHARQPQTRLLIVGDGPEREKLEGEIAKRGLQTACVFTGSVEASEVPGWLASMDVAVAPYPSLEKFYFSPLKVYEYMAAGLPVVASAVGQLNKLIRSGHNGVLVPPGNASALAEALHHLGTHPEIRARIGAAARAQVLAEHTWDSVARQILRLGRRANAAGTDVVPDLCSRPI